CQIAGDLREAAETALLVADRRDDDVGPEAGPVLADAPSFVFETALLGREAQLLLGPAGLDGFRRVEAREVLADDLLRRVSLEPLGADVPSLDATGRIEHVDRVVGNAIDQSPKALLAQTQLLFGVLPVGDVSRDLQVALHLTGRVANDRDHDVRPKARAVLSHAPAFVLEATRPRGELELVLRPSRYHRLPRVE